MLSPTKKLTVVLLRLLDFGLWGQLSSLLLLLLIFGRITECHIRGLSSIL